MNYLVRFTDARALDPDIVGQKFASLAKAHRLGFPVPEAFAVITGAHRFFISNGVWPEGLYEEVLEAAAVLNLSNGLSIRSSATREDLESASFAGQYRSFLWVTDQKDLVDKIEKCWRSAGTETVRAYLKAIDADTESESPLMGVLLQKMIHAKAAGVAFGQNPMSPSKEEIVIEAAAGSPEDLVSGRITPHRAFIGKAESVRMETPEGHRPGAKSDPSPLLSHDRLQAIAGLVYALEETFNLSPLDIEWAVDQENRLWLLQARRVTAVESGGPPLPQGVWSRKIADDLWADRLTPFMADALLRNSNRFDLTEVIKKLRLPDIQPKLAVIDGYLYVNSKAAETLLKRIPARFRFREIRALFPRQSPIGTVSNPSIFELLDFGLRVLMLLIREPRANPLLCSRVSRKDQILIKQLLVDVERLPTSSVRASHRKMTAALDVLSEIQEKNQWPYFYALFLTWMFRWLVVDVLNLSHQVFLRLISGRGSNITVRIERDLAALAKKIMKNESLCTRFIRETPERIYSDLPDCLHGPLAAFLAEYGCRARHRTLSVKRWAEAPHEVIGMLQALVRSEQKRVPGQNDAGPRSPDPRPEEHPAGHFLLISAAVRAVQKLNRTYLDLREDLRFLLDRALYQIRISLLELGRHLSLGEATLFLTLDELTSILDGRMAIRRAKALADKRRRSFYRNKDAADFVIDGSYLDEFSPKGKVVYGIGTSPGRATGKARIVTNPLQAGIRNGDILVAKNTDPGWTPILSLAKGMVMEQGGLLNHCSIVARELGIPAVAGVKNATRIIEDGATVTIDGGMGMIRIEEGM